jgi:ribonuclease HI
VDSRVSGPHLKALDRLGKRRIPDAFDNFTILPYHVLSGKPMDKAPPAWYREIAEMVFPIRAGDTPDSVREAPTPPVALTTIPSITLFTDGSKRGSTQSFASVSFVPLPGWSHVADSPHYVLGWRVTVYGAEEPSINTMELMAVVESLERCGSAHVTIYSDSAYAVQKNPSLLPRRCVRSADRALWRRLDDIISLRTSLGLFTEPL